MQYRKFKTSIALALSAAIASSALFTSCGPVKNQADKTVTVESAPGSSSDQKKKQADLVNNIVEILNLYGDPAGDGSFSREGLTHMLEKFKPTIEGFLSGSGLKIEQLIDFIFSFDSNKDKKISTTEVVNGLKSRIRVLGWFSDDKTPLSRDQILANLTKDYPEASATAKEGLANMLMSFDESWADGNHDHLLDLNEISIPGVVMAVLDSTDLRGGFQAAHSLAKNAISSSATAGPRDPNSLDAHVPQIIEDQVNLKLRQQLFTRYPSADPKLLSVTDNRLEWTQLALKFLLVDRSLRRITWDTSLDGFLKIDQVKTLVTQMGFEEVTHSKSFPILAKFYDSPFVGGMQDNTLNSIELFQLITDLEFSKKIAQYSSLLRNKELVNLIFNPKLSTSTQFVDSIISKNETSLFVQTSAEDFAALTLETAYIRLVGVVFSVYDTNHDDKISKTEMLSLIKAIKPELSNAKQLVQAFFADVIPESGKPSATETAEAVFQYLKYDHTLSGGDVLIRLRHTFIYAIKQKLPLGGVEAEGNAPEARPWAGNNADPDSIFTLPEAKKNKIRILYKLRMKIKGLFTKKHDAGKDE